MSITPEIVEILKKGKTIAVVGASRNPSKAAHSIPKYLKEHGYTIIPVNPLAETILDEKVYPKLIDIPVQVDIVDVFRPSEDTPAVVAEAVKLKPKLIWLQLGITNEEAKKIADDNGIPIVMDKCMKIEHMRLFHQH
ncbi:MAG: CoA-binding protein [Candidatus Heimdallarchaeota archaeon]|nr:CoA-binding protein [Candidatus Heimdallarchaeota archaeon]MBY8993913.1 CoA-binding protein [Candidatus Heimdallarchaeota archaeon]